MNEKENNKKHLSKDALNIRFIRVVDGGVLLDVQISPRSSKNRIVGVHNDRIKICLAAPPVDGKANEALVEYLAKVLEIAKRQISIEKGQTSKLKTLRIAAEFDAVLQHILYGQRSDK